MSVADVAAAAKDIAAKGGRVLVAPRNVPARGDFEKVDYQIVDEPAYPSVQFTAVEKSWGPDFVRFDLGLGATAGGDFAFALRGEHTRTWLNACGGEWRSILQIGQEISARTGIYQPLEVRQRYFVEPFLRIDRNLEDLYDDGDKVAEFAVLESYGQLDFGINVGTVAQFRAGIRQDWGTAKVETGEILPDRFTDEVGLGPSGDPGQFFEAGFKLFGKADGKRHWWHLKCCGVAPHDEKTRYESG